MKVAVIGDIHGTTKFKDCYNQIKTKDDDIDKIIVMGDWFDPYDDISCKTMIDRYNFFNICCKMDDRIISLLGNHDLSGYIIQGQTNRTAWSYKNRKMITDAISENLPNSYLVYKIGKWLFSHAGVSQEWLNRIKEINPEYPEMIFSNKKGWGRDILNNLCAFYDMDFSMCGDDPNQGCTWIRPTALIKSLPEGYNQVIGHSQVDEIVNLKEKDPTKNIKNDIWLVDNMRKPEYLLLNIEENE